MDFEKLAAAAKHVVVVPLDLGAFHDRFAGQEVQVRVSLSRREVRQLQEFKDDDRNIQFIGALCGLSPDETRLLFGDTSDNAFLGWLVEQVMERYREYAEGRKKKDAHSSTGSTPPAAPVPPS